MTPIACPRCATNIPITSGMAGQKLRCPNCNQKLQVPGVAPPPPQSLVPGSKQWFYRRGEESFGPVTAADLTLLASEDRLARKDMLWSEGMANWQAAGQIQPRLFADQPDSGGRMWEGAGVAIYSTIVGVVLLVMACGMYLLISRKTADKPAVTAAKGNEEEKAPPKPVTLKPEEIAAKCKPAVVRIVGTSKTSEGTMIKMGSGFLVGDQGFVVTNSHVVDGNLIDSLEVSFPNGDPKKYRPKLLYEDRKNDLAVLKIDSPTPPLPLADAPPVGGAQVVVIGSPGSITSGGAMKNTVSVGNFGTIDTVNDVEVYHITAAINGGNSGGPAFDDQGRVFGVVTLSAVGKEAQNFAMTIPNIRNALSKARLLEKKYDQTGAEHDLAEIYQRYSLMTAYQQHALVYYYMKMDEARKAGRDVTTAISSARAQKLGRGRWYKTRLLDPIETEARSIISNPALEASGLYNNRDILALRELATDAQRILESPTANAAALTNAVSTFISQRKRLVPSLRGRLGVPTGKILYRAYGLSMHEHTEMDLTKLDW